MSRHSDPAMTMHDPDERKRERLRRMKWVAHGLLIAATLLFAAASLLESRHPAYSYLAAFAEAAMVGAIADWFAVVALFRHPLGMRFIPHTAIIPANRARIADNLGNFVQGEFFSTPRILAVIRDVDPARRAGSWLADPVNRREIADLAGGGVRYLIRHADLAQGGAWLKERIAANASALDIAGWVASVLELATAGDRHQAILDQLMQSIDGMLGKPHVRETVEQMLADALPLYFETLKIAGGRLAAERVVASMQKLFNEIADDPNHELRQRFNTAIAGFIERLRSDAAFRESIGQYVADTVRSPAFADYLGGVLGDLIQWADSDISQETSRIRLAMEGVIAHVARALQEDEALADWINSRILESAPPVIDRFRPRIGSFIARKMHEWKDEEIVDKLELQIGPDLQFIRFNGTIVGGLAGLLIHTAGQWLAG